MVTATLEGKGIRGSGLGRKRQAEYEKILKFGLQTLSDLNLHRDATARILGYDISDQDEMEEIHRHLKAFRNIDVEQRLIQLIDIVASAEALFGKNFAKLERWLETPHQELGGGTPKGVLTSGNLLSLIQVNGLLAKMTETGT